MYAAAGGASLASRQARQRQRQQKKTQQLQAKLHPPKASALSVAEHGASPPTRQSSRQFHQLPTNYLRTPQAQSRKLSASYTAQSKLLLPIDEGDTQSVLHMRMHSHVHMHHMHSHGHASTHQQQHQHQPQQHYYNYTGGHGRVSPKLVHRHSGSSGTSFHHSHLPKSATATYPLVSQVEATPPTTPSGAVVAKASAAAAPLADHDAIIVPHHDAIIVTPATPMASPGHVAKLHDELPDSAAEKQPLTAVDAYDDDEPMQPPTGPLERKCSVYRMRRSDAFEHDADIGAGTVVKRQLKELQFNQQQQYEPLLTDEPQLLFKGLPNGRKWQLCAYCEEGICVCEHIECAQGRAAWLERGRRCSVQESQQQAVSHRRWVKRNRIQDASLGGSSDDEDFLGVLRGPSTFANAFLYVGLGTVALGLVIAFVGTGEKGFKTVELRLIGPSLIGIGLVCCILRILFCICPSHCISSSKKTRKKNGNKVDADHTTSLLRGESKRVSIARGPSMQPKYPITHKRSNSKMLNEGMEALRQIATTSLFMQNEQKHSMNRVVPIIKEPENTVEASLEMRKLETALNVCEIGNDEEEDDENNTEKANTTNTATPAYKDATITAISTTALRKSAHVASTTTSSTTTTNAASPFFGSASKHSRQRVPLHHQQQQPEQSQSLSSSSTVKDSIDADGLMETSLMVLNPNTLTSETRPPVLKSTPSATITNSTTSPIVSSLPPPPMYTGAISRISSVSQAHTVYDLPPSTPHSYAAVAAATSSRLSTERESLIRGPLGMPLSALTASSSTYIMPVPAPAPTINVTTISLLPLPVPQSTSTTAPTTSTTFNQNCIPGQVMDPAPSTSYAAETTRLSIPNQQSIATTSLNILLPTNQPTITSPTCSNVPVLEQQLQFKTSTPPIASGSYKCSDSLVASALASSSASSNGRTGGTGISNTNGATLAPPHTSAASKFEPELLLSPAKLGQ